MRNTAYAERELGLLVREQLNAGTSRLNKPVLDRLHTARQVALARQATASSQFALAGAARHTLSWGEGNLRPLLLALSLAAAILCGNQLMSMQRQADIEEVDSALLTDDLPINAYLDNGFRSWLANPSSQR